VAFGDSSVAVDTDDQEDGDSRLPPEAVQLLATMGSRKDSPEPVLD